MQMFPENFSQAGFTKITFKVRGNLYSGVYLRLEFNNGNSTTASGNNAWMSNSSDRKITSNWQSYEFNISGSLSKVKDLLRIVFLKYDEDGTDSTPNTAKGNGGTIYLDDIVLTKVVKTVREDFGPRSGSSEKRPA